MGLDRLLAAVAAFFVALFAIAGTAVAAQTGPASSATRMASYLPFLSSSGPALITGTLDDGVQAWTTPISPTLSIAFRNTQPVAVSYQVVTANGGDADTAGTGGVIVSGSTVRMTVHLAATSRASVTFRFSAIDDRSLAVNFLTRVFGPSANVEGYMSELQNGPGALLRDVLRLALTDALQKSPRSANLAARIRTLTSRFAGTPRNRAWVLRLLGPTHGKLADWPRNMGAAAAAYAGLAHGGSADQTVILRARRQADGTGGSAGVGGGAGTAGSTPKILRIDGTSYAVPSQGAATLTFQDAECDVVGGTWFGSDGSSHDFGNGSQQPVSGATPYSCAGGVGQFTPFTVTCGGPGQWTEAAVIRDAAGHTSPRFEFQHICTGPAPIPTVTAVVVSVTTGVTDPSSTTPGDQLRCDVLGNVSSITYTWRRYVYTAPSSYSFSAIPGATGSSYTVTAADLIPGSSTFIGCSVNYSFAGGNSTGGGGIATAGIPVRPG